MVSILFILISVVSLCVFKHLFFFFGANEKQWQSKEKMRIADVWFKINRIIWILVPFIGCVFGSAILQFELNHPHMHIQHNCNIFYFHRKFLRKMEKRFISWHVHFFPIHWILTHFECFNFGFSECRRMMRKDKLL